MKFRDIYLCDSDIHVVITTAFTYTNSTLCLVVTVLDLRLDGRGFNCHDEYWDMWPSFGMQTTPVFHQATKANSAFYPQQDGKWVPSKSAVMLCSWG